MEGLIAVQHLFFIFDYATRLIAQDVFFKFVSSAKLAPPEIFWRVLSNDFVKVLFIIEY